jgi:hypothetical protein
MNARFVFHLRENNTQSLECVCGTERGRERDRDRDREHNLF